jgi:hypothetical protein
MQCPNCRKIEKGNWLYANGSRSAHDINMEEWAHDEDLYDLNYSDVVHDHVLLTLKLFVLVRVLILPCYVGNMFFPTQFSCGSVFSLPP